MHPLEELSEDVVYGGVGLGADKDSRRGIALPDGSQEDLHDRVGLPRGQA